MKFLFHNPQTPLAGMPWRTAMVIDRYLKSSGQQGWARAIATFKYGDGREFPADGYVLDPRSTGATQMLQDADVVVVASYGSKVPNKPTARHLSTEQFRWQEQNPSPEDTTVVAQYQARFAPQLSVLPNCIPIDHERWMPAEKPTDRVVILYTPTSRTEGKHERARWSRKGYAQTLAALKKIQVKYGDRVEIIVLEGRPYEEVMLARRHAHIVIDECATGSYHSVALEGLSCGCVTVCWIDAETEAALTRLFSNQRAAFATLPFVLSTLTQLKRNLEALVANPDMILMQGKASRKWMERHYSESWQARKWLSWHGAFLQRVAPSTVTQ